VENTGKSQDGYPTEFPGLYGVILLLTSSSLGTLFVIDPWAMAVVGMFMVARLLNILVIRGWSWIGGYVYKALSMISRLSVQGSG
jgi:hypothetical protein